MTYRWRWFYLGRGFGFESKWFVAYFWFVGWHCLSLGVHLSLDGPHIEVHIPFGFVRAGVPSRSARYFWDMQAGGKLVPVGKLLFEN